MEDCSQIGSQKDADDSCERDPDGVPVPESSFGVIFLVIQLTRNVLESDGLGYGHFL